MSQTTTQGGRVAHVFRRLFHLLMLIVTFVYYDAVVPLASEKVRRLCILAFIFLVFLFEKFRIRAKLLLFGQRFYEATRISGFAWTMLGLSLVLFFAREEFAVPIVATCAFVDPFLGEMRLRTINSAVIFISGVLLALLIWMVSAYHYHFPWWYGCVLAPVSVAVEWPKLRWIDDNALMLLVPLVLVAFL